MALSTGMIAIAIMAMAQDAAPVAPACTPPQPPAVERAVKPERPATPSCVNEATHRHTCSNRVIASYETSMSAYGVAFDSYVASVNAYVGKLSAYIDAASEYGRCEQRIVVPSRIIEP